MDLDYTQWHRGKVWQTIFFHVQPGRREKKNTMKSQSVPSFLFVHSK